jgi:hypothetical protein
MVPTRNAGRPVEEQQACAFFQALELQADGGLGQMEQRRVKPNLHGRS